ncbi:type II toxin-antitoxin system YoeB family toxin [Lacticaseibacillus zhaodongensis]|uniref:type II toxin-antitoxin system YoeB family toxin n=1 Tax=Lacticaseibacillus zhaodongensis TaxID=2668065 RepID=UPI001E2EFCCA|nr:type II toxin-antitoxin system YoeB family toxin [Lacticaseibacillus zhaodongensis]
MSTNNWKVVPHREVRKKDEPLLERAGLHENYMAVIETLKQNPYSREHNQELLHPHSRNIYSMHINDQHRCVYTIDKEKRLVKIWSAWSHYEKRMPK